MFEETFTDIAQKLPTWVKIDNVGQTVALALLMNGGGLNVSTQDQMFILLVNSTVHGLLHDLSCAAQKSSIF